MSEQTKEQIIRFAIRREQEAYKFILAIREVAKFPGIKFLLEDMAKEELEHKEKLELELIKLGEVVPEDDLSQTAYKIESDEIAEMDYADLLVLGMEKEDISFRMYIDLALKAGNTESRDAFLAIAEQELRHKIRFEIEYEKLPQK
ncbi:MAG: ferritin family protein [Phycisphaerae bacterium]|jgi:rubrerythrin